MKDKSKFYGYGCFLIKSFKIFFENDQYYIMIMTSKTENE